MSSFYVLTTSHWDKWDYSDCLRWQWWGFSGEDREPNERTRWARAVTGGCKFFDFVSSRHYENPNRDVIEVAIGQDIWRCWQFCDLVMNSWESMLLSEAYNVKTASKLWNLPRHLLRGSNSTLLRFFAAYFRHVMRIFPDVYVNMPTTTRAHDIFTSRVPIIKVGAFQFRLDEPASVRIWINIDRR